MKKLLAMMLMLLPMIAWGQTKATTTPIKVFGIPLGITAKEFKAQYQNIKAQLPAMTGEDEAYITLNMYEGTADDAIVWQVALKTENKYVSASASGFRITSILSAKYGAPKESINVKERCLRWDLKNGYIVAWYEKQSFYVQFVDYAALKKALPDLYKGL